MKTRSATATRIPTVARVTRNGRGWPTCQRYGERLFPAAGVPVCVACPIPFRLTPRATVRKGGAR